MLPEAGTASGLTLVEQRCPFWVHFSRWCSLPHILGRVQFRLLTHGCLQTRASIHSKSTLSENTCGQKLGFIWGTDCDSHIWYFPLPSVLCVHVTPQRRNRGNERWVLCLVAASLPPAPLSCRWHPGTPRGDGSLLE